MYNSFEIIENTKEAQKKYGYLYGYGEYKINKKQIEALLNGKQLATEINDEYVIFITLDRKESEGE